MGGTMPLGERTPQRDSRRPGGSVRSPPPPSASTGRCRRTLALRPVAPSALDQGVVEHRLVVVLAGDHDLAAKLSARSAAELIARSRLGWARGFSFAALQPCAPSC